MKVLQEFKGKIVHLWKWFVELSKIKKAIVIVMILALCALIAVLIVLQPSRATASEFNSVTSNTTIEVIENKDTWIIRPLANRDDQITTSIVFVTGGLVEPKAYLYNLSKITEQTGYTIYLPKVLLNLAFFEQDVVDKTVKTYNLTNYYVAGHSLGGVVACYYVKDNLTNPNLKGIILMASYCDKDIESYTGTIISLVGSNDGVINTQSKQEKDSSLPSQAQFVTIDGMNHGQFGSYGKQKGDNKPSVSNEESAKNFTTEIVKRIK